MEVRCCCRHRILLQSLGLDLEWCLDSDKTSRIYTEKNAWNETNDSFYTGISAIILEGWVYERLGKSHSPIWNLCCSDLGGQRNLLFGVRQLFKKKQPHAMSYLVNGAQNQKTPVTGYANLRCRWNHLFQSASVHNQISGCLLCGIASWCEWLWMFVWTNHV